MAILVKERFRQLRRSGKKEGKEWTVSKLGLIRVYEVWTWVHRLMEIFFFRMLK